MSGHKNEITIIHFFNRGNARALDLIKISKL